MKHYGALHVVVFAIVSFVKKIVLTGPAVDIRLKALVALSVCGNFN